MLMGRTITLPLATLAPRPRTNGYCGHAKAYAVQQHGDRRQYCHLNTFAHRRVLSSRIVTTVQCSPRAIKRFSSSHPAR